MTEEEREALTEALGAVRIASDCLILEKPYLAMESIREAAKLLYQTLEAAE